MKVTECDNNYSTTTQQLAESIQRSAGTAAVYGAELEQIIGYTTAITQVTREAGTVVGNALKTIFSRITSHQGAIEQLSNLGISIEDSTTGDVRQVPDILDDIAGKWNDMSTAQQQSLGLAIAGRHQISRFLVLMEQWDQAVSATATATHSQGSAMRENERYLDSYEAKLNKVRNAWTEAVISMEEDILGDALLIFTDTAIPMLNTLTSIIDTVGLLPPIFGAATTALLLFKRASVMEDGRNTLEFFRALTRRAERQTAVITGLTRAKVGWSTAMYGARRAAIALGTAVRTLGTFLAGAVLPIAGFMALGYAISTVTGYLQDQKQAREEYERNQQNSLENLNSEQEQINNLVAEYERLDNAGVSRNMEQEERYVELQNELGNLLPSVVVGEDAKGNAILANTEIVAEYIAMLERQREIEEEQILNTADSTLSGNIISADEIKKEIADLEADLERQSKDMTEYQNNEMDGHLEVVEAAYTATSKKISDLYQDLNDVMGETENVARTVAGRVEGLTSSEINAIGNITLQQDITSQEEIQVLGQRFAELKETAGGIELGEINLDQLGVLEQALAITSDNADESSARFKAFSDELQRTGMTANQANNILGNLIYTEQDIIDAAKEMGATTQGTVPVFNEFGQIIRFIDADLSGLVDSFEDSEVGMALLNDKIEEAQGDFEALRDIIVEVAAAGDIERAATLMQVDAYEALADEVSPLNGLLEKMAEGKQLSSAEAINLINQEEALTDAIRIENGVVKVNEDAVRDLRDAKIQGYADMQEAVIAETEQVAQATLNNLKNYGIEIQAIQDLASARQALNDVILGGLEAESNLRQGYSAEGDLIIPNRYVAARVNQQTGYIDEVKAEIDVAADQINNIARLYDQVENRSEMVRRGLHEVGTEQEKLSEQSDKSSDSNKNQTAELQESTFVADTYAEALAQVNSALEILRLNQNKYAQHSKQYRDALKQEMELLEAKNDILVAQSEALQEQIRSGRIYETGIVTDSTTVTLPSSGGSSGGSRASGSGTAATIWNFLKAQGFSDNHVAGIMGNMQLESGLSTTATNASSGAYGLVQWLGVRKSALQNYASNRGTSPSNLGTQLDFLMHELRGSESRMMNWFRSNPNASASQTAHAFDRIFERSEGTHVPQRQRYANQFLNRFSGSGSSSGGADTADLASLERDRINELNQASRDEAQRQQALNQAQLDLLNMHVESERILAEIAEIPYRIVESYIAEFDYRQKQLEEEFARLDYQQSAVGERTREWVQLEQEREQLLADQRDIQKESIAFIEDEIKTNKALSQAQKARLDEQILDRTVQLWQMEQEILNIRISMAEQAIDVYNQALEAQKEASVQAIDDLIAEIDKEMAEEDWNKSLRDKTKERQELLDELAELALDDSDSARKRMRELTDSLQEIDEELDEMLTDRETDLRKEALQEQRDEVEEEYNDIINDERRMAKLRKDIIQNNTKEIQNDLERFFDEIGNLTDQLGKTTVNNLLDMIEVVNEYLGGTDNLNLPKFHKGGGVKVRGGMEGLAVLKDDEFVLNPQDTDNLKDAVNMNRALLNQINVPSLSRPNLNTNTNSGNSLHLSLNIDNMHGNKEDAHYVLNESIKGFEKMGFKF